MVVAGELSDDLVLAVALAGWLVVEVVSLVLLLVSEVVGLLVSW